MKKNILAPDRLHNVIAEVMGVPVETLTDEDTPSTIESWDSMAHLNLVLALQAEFGIELSSDEAAEMLSVGQIRRILLERGVVSHT
jgi:acyl carrier protein